MSTKAEVELAEPKTSCQRCLHNSMTVSPHHADYVVKVAGYAPYRTCGRHLADTIDYLLGIPPIGSGG